MLSNWYHGYSTYLKLEGKYPCLTIVNNPISFDLYRHVYALNSINDCGVCLKYVIKC